MEEGQRGRQGRGRGRKGGENWLSSVSHGQASPVHGILQARILEWVAIPFSRGSSPPRGQVDSLLAEPAGKPMEIHPENPP